MDHDDVACALARRVGHDPVRCVREGVAEHEDIAPGDVRIVGETQDRDAGIGDCHPHGGRGFRAQRPQDDIGAFLNRLPRDGGRRGRIAVGVVDPQVDVTPVCSVAASRAAFSSDRAMIASPPWGELRGRSMAISTVSPLMRGPVPRRGPAIWQPARSRASRPENGAIAAGCEDWKAETICSGPPWTIC
jgi:hypothetical protein